MPNTNPNPNPCGAQCLGWHYLPDSVLHSFLYTAIKKGNIKIAWMLFKWGGQGVRHKKIFVLERLNCFLVNLSALSLDIILLGSRTISHSKAFCLIYHHTRNANLYTHPENTERAQSPLQLNDVHFPTKDYTCFKPFSMIRNTLNCLHCSNM